MNPILRVLRKCGMVAFIPVLAACLSVDLPTVTDPGRLAEGGHHVLFIGNSLTYTNDLPGTLSALAESGGDTIRVASVSLPNFAVIDHALGQSNAANVIKSQPWEYVILQQGPTTVGVNRDTLIIATKLLDPIVRQAGGRTGQFMTWPNSDAPQLFPAVRASSQAAAASVSDGVFFPVGDAWRVSLEADPQVQLYGPDGYHPGPLGTYLAALVIYERVTGHDARLLPGVAVVRGTKLTVAEPVVRYLQRIAHETVVRFR